MSVLLVIPARGGSKGIPRKNLQLAGGKPLIAYAIENALRAQRPDQVIVSTEDEEIARVAKEYGAEVPFVRPKKLGEDHVSLIPVVVHAAQEMKQYGFEADIVLSLQPTTPFISPKTIDKAVALQEQTGCDSVVSVVKVTHNHPYRIQSLDKDKNLHPHVPEGEKFLQRQDLPSFYAFSGGLYVRKKELLESWSGNDFCLGEKRRGVVVPDEEALNIDRPIDLTLFRAMLSESAQTH